MLPTFQGRPGAPASAARSVGPLDILLITLLFALFLFASWFRSRNRIFWSDEIMGWFVLRQDTWPHLLQLWRAGIDSSGIFYYVFARQWLALFGPSELTLHLFSAFGIALSATITWFAARRFFPIQVVAAVVPLMFFLNRTALWQLANGRTYGLLMTAIALAAYALIRTGPETADANRPWPLLLTFLALLLLVGSHILGTLFWGAFFAGFLTRDLWFRIFRPRLYSAALAALIVVPFSWRNIQATAALGKPTFWTLKPPPLDLFRGLGDYSRFTEGILAAAFLALLVTILIARSKGTRPPVFNPAYPSFYFALAVFPFLLLVMFAVSHVSTSIFVDRYLLPMLVGDALFVCALLGRCFEIMPPGPAPRALFSIAALLVFGVVYQKNLRFESVYPQRDYTPALLAALPEGEPIVMTSVGSFAEMVFYHNRDGIFLTPVDWSIQLDPDNGPGGVSGLHEMENWKAMGLYSKQIQPTPEILRGKPHFAVVSDDQHTLWFRRYIAANPLYRSTEGKPFGTLHIWQVDRR